MIILDVMFLEYNCIEKRLVSLSLNNFDMGRMTLKEIILKLNELLMIIVFTHWIHE